MSDAPEDWRSRDTFSFGDSPELADELAQLVLAGKKTATCWAASEAVLSSRHTLAVQRCGQPINLPIVHFFCNKAEFFCISPKCRHAPGCVRYANSYICIFNLAIGTSNPKHIFQCDLIFFINIEPFNFPGCEVQLTERGTITLLKRRVSAFPADKAEPEFRLHVAERNDIDVRYGESDR